MSKKMGRPKKPANEVKKNKSVRFNDEQLEVIELFRMEGMTFQDALNELVLYAALRRKTGGKNGAE